METFPCVVCDAKEKHIPKRLGGERDARKPGDPSIAKEIDDVLVAMLFVGATVDPAIIAAGLCAEHAALMDSCSSHVATGGVSA